MSGENTEPMISEELLAALYEDAAVPSAESSSFEELSSLLSAVREMPEEEVQAGVHAKIMQEATRGVSKPFWKWIFHPAVAAGAVCAVVVLAFLQLDGRESFHQVREQVTLETSAELSSRPEQLEEAKQPQLSQGVKLGLTGAVAVDSKSVAAAADQPARGRTSRGTDKRTSVDLDGALAVRRKNEVNLPTSAARGGLYADVIGGGGAGDGFAQAGRGNRGASGGKVAANKEDSVAASDESEDATVAETEKLKKSSDAKGKSKEERLSPCARAKRAVSAAKSKDERTRLNKEAARICNRVTQDKSAAKDKKTQEKPASKGKKKK